MELDTVWKELGQFGRYQLWIFFLLFFTVVYGAFYSISFLFTAGDLQYRCYVPECEILDTAKYKANWLSNALPFEKSGNPLKCSRFKNNNDSMVRRCDPDSFYQNEITKCTEFVFETNEKTIVNEFGIYCRENQWKLTAVGTLNNIGQFIGLPLAGIFSDKYGRKTTLITTMLLSMVMGLLRSFSPTYGIFLLFELLDAIVSSGNYSAAFILGIEIVGSEKRVLGSALLCSSYSIGEIILGVIAWYIPDWKIFLRVLYLPGLIFVFYIWLIPESIRWLVTKNKYNEARKILDKAAIINKKSLQNRAWHHELELLETTENKSKPPGRDPSSEENHSTLKQVLKSKILMLRILNCSFCWITHTFIYYGLLVNSVTVAGNKHMNFILVSLVEMPAYISTLFILDKYGRKMPLLSYLILSGLACVSFYFIPTDMVNVRLFFFLIGKCCITASFATLYIFASELFPTNVRHSLLGTCSMFGRVGSVFAPQTPLMHRYFDPVLLFGVLALTSGFFCLFFPETLNTQLPDTVKQAEKIGKKNSIKEEAH